MAVLNSNFTFDACTRATSVDRAIKRPRCTERNTSIRSPRESSRKDLHAAHSTFASTRGLVHVQDAENFFQHGEHEGGRTCARKQSYHLASSKNKTKLRGALFRRFISSYKPASSTLSPDNFHRDDSRKRMGRISRRKQAIKTARAQ